MKELPKVFANKIDKNLENNDLLSYSKNEEKTKEVRQKDNNFNPEINLNQKLNYIFNSPRYVYKADVEITLKDKTVVKKIIGQNQNYLITIENELIPISEIIDIDFTQ